MGVEEISNQDGFNKIKNQQSDKLSVIVFDDGSRMSRSMINKLAADNELETKACFYKLELKNRWVENEARNYKVETYPTFVLLKNGEVKGRSVGIDKEELKKSIYAN